MRSIGVDFGTCFCRISMARRDPFHEAAVVAFSERSQEILAVGDAAATMLGKTPTGVRAAYPLARGSIRDPKLATALLKHLLQRALGRGVQKPRMVVAASGSLTSVERRGLGRLAHDVGAAETRFVDAALAAAIGMDLDVGAAQAHLVLDVGAGLSKAAVISLGGVVQAMASPAAGDAMDDAIARFLRRDMGMMVGGPSVEALKHAIGSATHPSERSYRIVGRDVVTGLPRDMTVRESEVHYAIAPILADIAHMVQDLLAQMSPEILSDIATSGAYLIGGASELVGLDDYLEERLGIAVQRVEQPGLVTARGLRQLIERPQRYPLIKLRTA